MPGYVRLNLQGVKDHRQIIVAAGAIAVVRQMEQYSIVYLNSGNKGEQPVLHVVEAADDILNMLTTGSESR